MAASISTPNTSVLASGLASGLTYKQRAAARAARVASVLAQLDRLIRLVPLDKTISKSGENKEQKDQRAFSKMVHDLNHLVLALFRDNAERTSPFATPYQRKTFARLLSKFNTTMNELRSLCASLRTRSEDGLTPVHVFVRSHFFPSYDLTNGFESDEVVEERMRVLQNPVPPTIVSRVDEAEFDFRDPKARAEYQASLVLHASRRKVAYASSKDEAGTEAMKSAILYAIERATNILAVNHVERKPHGHKGTRETGAYGPTLPDFGTVSGYCLDLFFAEGCTIASASVELKRVVELIPGFLGQYIDRCHQKIVTLVRAGITKKDPGFENILLVFCKHAGCSHASGFFFNRKPVTSFDRLRDRPQCPNGHGFCQRCRDPTHAGFCVDFDEQRRTAIEQAMRENPGLSIKPCPSCAEPIEKNAGCDHMKCDGPNGCGWHFCWQCLMMFSTSEQFYNGHRQCSGRAGVW